MRPEHDCDAAGALGNSDHLVGCCRNAFERYFVKLGAMPHRHGSGNGITTSSILHCGCGGGKSDGGSRGETAHIATFVEPADSRSGGGGRCATLDTPRSWHRLDGGGSSVSRSRSLGVVAG